MATVTEFFTKPPKELLAAMRAMESEDTREAGVVVFIGPHISNLVHKQDASTPYLHIGAHLLHKLLSTATIPESIKSIITEYLGQGNEIMATEALYQAMGANLPWQLRSILEPDGIKDAALVSQTHRILSMLQFRRVITTNYDRLLEYLLKPTPEVLTLTSSDFEAMQFFVKNQRKRLLFKLHGNITTPSTICFTREQQRKIYMRIFRDAELVHVRRFLEQVVKENTMILLGFTFDENDSIVEFLRECSTAFATRLDKHYALVQDDSILAEFRRRVAHEIGIKFITYPGEHDEGIPTFLTRLGVDMTDKPVPEPGQPWQRLFDPDSGRPEYLKYQLSREQNASMIFFLTRQLTNAIAPAEYLKSIKKEQKAAPDYMEDMERRRANLEERLRNHKVEVRCLCFADVLNQEFAEGSTEPALLRAIVRRYEWVLDLARTTALQIRLIGNMTEKQRKDRETSYAVIYSEHRTGQYDPDVTFAYAAQVQNKGQTEFREPSMIQINTPETERRVAKFEEFWATAWSSEASLKYIENMIAEAGMLKRENDYDHY